LLHRFGVGSDFHGVLSDIPRDARHVRGTPHEYVTVRAKKVKEHDFLFGVEGGADVHHLAVQAIEVK
jgi:hypothetical protein